jgi:hypothetical protein
MAPSLPASTAPSPPASTAPSPPAWKAPSLPAWTAPSLLAWKAPSLPAWTCYLAAFMYGAQQTCRLPVLHHRPHCSNIVAIL